MREHEALDARRSDRLSTEKLSGERLEVGERGRVVVQLPAGLLRVRGCGGDVRAEQEIVVCDRRRHVGLIGEAAPSVAAAERSRACVPVAVDQPAPM